MPPLAPPLRDYTALAARVRTAAGGGPPGRLLSWSVIGQQTSPAGDERYDLYLVRIPATGSAGKGPWRVYLNGGTHGDEPAGAEAVTRFLEQGRYRAWPDVAFTVTPCLNPWGYAHDRREGPSGRDLNRAFRRAAPTTPEVGTIKRALRGRAFDLFLDCHEDVDAPGLYVFAPRGLGRAIVEAVRAVGPVHPGPAVDGEIPLKESVVVLDDPDRAREGRRAWTTWPLPFYVGRYHRRPTPAISPEAPDAWRMESATIETPTALALDQRVAMHLAAIDAALAYLTGRPSPASLPSLPRLPEPPPGP
jgi:hypothetical protein